MVTNNTDGTNTTTLVDPPIVGNLTIRRIYAGGSSSDVFGLESDGRLLRFLPETGNWTTLNGSFERMTVGCDGSRTGPIIGVTLAGNAWRREPDGTWLEVASGVKMVAYGDRAYALDQSGELFKFTLPGPETSPRERLMFPLRQKFDTVGSGAGDTLFGARDGGKVHVLLHGDDFHRKLGIEQGPVLRRLQGGLWERVVPKGSRGPRIIRAASGGNGQIYGLTRKGRVVSRNQQGGWDPVEAPEAMRDIGVSCSGVVWAVSRQLHTYRLRSDGAWERVLETLTRVSLGNTAHEVWGVNGEQDLVLYSTHDQKFVVQAGGRKIRRISAGCDGELWAVSEAGRLLSRPAAVAEWTERGRGVKVVAHGARGTYVLDRRGLLWRYQPPQRAEDGEGKSNWVAMHKQLRSIATDADGALFGVDMKWRFVQFHPDGRGRRVYNDWIRVPGRLDDLCVGSRRAIYGLRNGRLLRWSEASKTFAVVPAPRLRSIRCGCDGVIWAMARIGSVYRFEDPKLGWERVPNSRSIGRLAVARKGQAWGVDRRGRPVEWDEKTRLWLPHPGRLRDIAVSCEGQRVGVGINGGLWQWDRATEKWAKIGAGVRRVAVGGSRIYAIGIVRHLFARRLSVRVPRTRAGRLRDAALWRIIGRKMRRVSTAVDGTVWGVDSKGRVWKIHHALRAELPKLPTAVPAAPAKADHEALQPDGWEADPFRAGADPVARALLRVNRKLPERMLRRIARAPGGILPKRPPISRPKPSQIRYAREAKLGDNPDPMEALPQNDLVDFVNLDGQ